MIDYLDEIVGQETAKRCIRTAVKRGNLYNFLLRGPKGVGKRLFGFAFAKTLGCPPQKSNFILVAPIPSKIKDKEDKISEYSKRYMPDNAFVDIEDRTSILIEQIRLLIERLSYMPSLGSKRVILILEADRMTDEAANCFLKTLEEPPLDTVFILTASRPDSLLPTIQSRCQKIPFGYLNNEQIRKVIFEASDDLMLGSPGEVLMLQQNNLIENVLDIFKNSPLTTQAASSLAESHQYKKLIDLFYPLLLLYRLALYHRLKLGSSSTLAAQLREKINQLSLEKIVGAIRMLNYSINILEQNPNRLLLLFNVLIRLP